jgi:hypothetical protein
MNDSIPPTAPPVPPADTPSQSLSDIMVEVYFGMRQHLCATPTCGGVVYGNDELCGRCSR